MGNILLFRTGLKQFVIVKIAQEGDIIVLAGKGHETYQIFKDKTIHYDEREIVKEILESME